MNMETNNSLDELLFNFEYAKDVHSRENCIELLVVRARKFGVEPEQLDKLVDLILSENITKKQSERLIKALIPRTTVRWLVVVNIVSWICSKKHKARDLQVTFIRWIIASFYDIDDLEPIHALYDIYFHYLDSVLLSPSISHLLSLITTKDDVKVHRVKRLTQLYHKMRCPKHLSGLLHIYQLLSPDMVTIQFENHKSYFNQRDNTWTPWVQRVRRITSVDGISWRSFNENTTETNVTIKILDNSSNNNNNGFEIANVANAAAHDVLFRNINNNKFPYSSKVMLENPLCLPFLSLYPQADIGLRLDMWVRYALAEICKENCYDSRDEHFEQLLCNVVRIEEYLQRGLPSTTLFLKKFLPSWNGQDYLKQILQLISWIPLSSFNELYTFILKPFEEKFATCHWTKKVLFLQTLTELLRNFAVVEMNKTVTKSNFLITEKISDVSPLDGILGFIDYVSVVDVLEDEDNTVVMDAIISFHELVADLCLKYKLPILVLLPETLLERILLSCNIFPIARLCALMCRNKMAFVSLKTALNSGLNSGHLCRSLSLIKLFNSYILRICNTLWMNRAFAQIDEELITFNIPKATYNALKIPCKEERLNCHQHIAFLGFALDFLKHTQNEDKVDVRRCVFNKSDVKDLYIKFLKKYDLRSVSLFIEEFIPTRNSQIKDK